MKDKGGTVEKKSSDKGTVCRKGDILEVEITDIGNDGEGIGKVDGYTLFIKDAVIGDRVRAKVMKAKKSYAYAHLEEVTSPSEFRQEAKCPIARACGGCQLQNMTYERQLEYKQNKVRNNIVRLGGFDGKFVDSIMEPIIGMDEPWRYRNKAQYPIGTDRDGNPVAGYYAGRTHSIIPVGDCFIGIEENRQVLDVLLSHMKRYHISAYDEAAGKGLVRHVLIRKGFASGQIMVCLVLNYFGERKKKERSRIDRGGAIRKGHSGMAAENFIPGQQALVDELSAIPGMTSISVSINTEKTNVIMGKEIHTIWGEPVIRDTLRSLEFEISPLSFYQVNPAQTDKLYGQALEYAGLTGTETVWDLYCGIGTITLSMAGTAGHVYGIEVIPEAIEDAKKNAVRNGIENATFFCGKAEEVLPRFYSMANDDPVLEEQGRIQGIDAQTKPCNQTEPENRGNRNDIQTEPGNQGNGNDTQTEPGNQGNDSNTQADSANMTKTEIESVAFAALRPDVIVVDPPRKGCDSACLDTMLKMQPSRIVYVSCDSATIARDLRILSEGGYELRAIRPCDMFPWSGHVETVVLLSHQQIKKSVAIDYTPDGSYMDNINKHATYKEINEYVLEKYGFRLHSAYIAQVKREMGIEMGENYNLSKSDDYEPRQVTPEKREAIIDALKHFNMIE